VRCAIVGSGLAAIAGYATLRHGGILQEDLTVFGTHEDPTAAWRERAAAIRQQRMRSESDGHVAASSFPGLAVREMLRQGTLKPMLQTATNRYHPLVEDFVRHTGRIVDESGWEQSFVQRRVERIRAVDCGFELDGEGPFEHVLVATGHPGLARIPDAVHAYEPHEYASRVAIVGAGMAAATEWLNALAAGAEVISIRRREPLRRPLNVPRPYFSKRGLASFHGLRPDDRATKLHELAAPSFPAGPEWDRPLVSAASEGRLTILRRGSEEAQTWPSDLQVICATGFRKGYRHDPLLSDLVDSHALPTHEHWILLDPDSTIATLTDETRTLALSGVAAQWAFPAADTIAGAKYAARAFLRRLCRTR
jgi:cation diffusion facilitator CzcD-associated flavoprotein CzcO